VLLIYVTCAETYGNFMTVIKHFPVVMATWRCMLKSLVLQVESAAERDLWIDAVNAAAEVTSVTKVSSVELEHRDSFI